MLLTQPYEEHMPFISQRFSRAASVPVDAVLCDTGLVTIGQFRAPVQHPVFHDSGPAERAIFVFPRTSVVIRHEAHSPFTADPCTVTFYNQGQRYTREPADPRGDASDWFAVRPDVLVDALRTYDPRVSERPENPFDYTHGPSDASSYLLQRLIVDYISTDPQQDPLAIEENVLAVFNHVVALRYGSTSRSLGRPAPDSAVTGLATEVRRYLGTRFRDASKLDDIAEAAGCSVFHLCRVFRREAGSTIHRYRLQLRLRRSLELVATAGSDLTGIALHLGFSSHSHFTAAFRHVFGITPSEFRRRPSLRRIREMVAQLSLTG